MTWPFVDCAITERRLLKNPEIAAAYSEEHHSRFGEGLHSQDRPNRRKTRKEMVPATLSRCKTGQSHNKDSHRI